MVFKQKKICLLFCAEPEVLGQKNINQASFTRWVDGFLELSLIADIKAEFIWQGNGLDSDWKTWQKLAQTIHKNSSRFDGFVVIHSLDNILYASSLMSYMLSGLKKPVVFTCTPVEPNIKFSSTEGEIFKDFSELTIMANLINAVQTACMDLDSINILTGSLLVRANMATRDFTPSLNLFSQFDDQSVGQVGFGLNIKPLKTSNQPRISQLSRIEPDVQIIDFFPGTEPELPNLENKKGLVIRSGQFNAWPDSLSNQIRKLDIPVLVVGLMDDNRAKEVSKLKNTIVARNIIFESALAKFVWSLGQTNDIGKLNKLFKQNIAGELG